MLCRGQNYEFVTLNSESKDNVTSKIKLQSTSFFLHIEPIYVVFIQSVSFQQILKIYKMAPWVNVNRESKMWTIKNRNIIIGLIKLAKQNEAWMGWNVI